EALERTGGVPGPVPAQAERGAADEQPERQPDEAVGAGDRPLVASLAGRDHRRSSATRAPRRARGAPSPSGSPASQGGPPPHEARASLPARPAAHRPPRA